MKSRIHASCSSNSASVSNSQLMPDLQGDYLEFRSGPENGRRKSRPMQTPLAKTLGIEFPIFAFTHCRDVAAAVSKAGGFGVLGALGRAPDHLDMELSWIEEHVGGLPYGVDIVL